MTRATNTYKTIKNIRVTTRNHLHKQLHVNIPRVINSINKKLRDELSRKNFNNYKKL